MPSIGSRLLKLQLRLAKPLVRFAGIEEARMAQDNLGKLTAKLLKTRASMQYVAEPFDAFEACWAIPRVCEDHDEKAILYLHGGGYTAGSLDYAQGFGGLLAEETHLQTLCVGYRLAPEDPYPAALDDAMSAYRRLLDKGYAPEKIAFVGESAGGGLSYCLALRCKAEGVPQPRCIVGISPWADLTLSGASCRNNVLRDPTLIREALAYYTLVYAAGLEREPFVSPLMGDLGGLPPSLLFAGADEILLDDARSLYAKLLAAGCQARLIVENGMWHVYPLYGTAESRRALVTMSAFICDALGAGKAQPDDSHSA